MHNFKELNVWKEAQAFSIKVYKDVAGFPSTEIYGITSQIKRAAVSIPSNIAEGAGRNTNKDFARFISIAIGSSFELETQLIISVELKFLDEEKYKELMSRFEFYSEEIS